MILDEGGSTHSWDLGGLEDGLGLLVVQLLDSVQQRGVG